MSQKYEALLMVLLTIMILSIIVTATCFLSPYNGPNVDIALQENGDWIVTLYPGTTEWRYKAEEIDKALAKAKEWLECQQDE